MSVNPLQFLEHIGISRKEVAVYMYLLSIESALPMEIAKGTRMKRSTVYVILDLLNEKGLVREIQRGKRFAYVAEEPERIRFLLEEHKLQTEISIQSLDAVLPQLKAILRRPGQPPLIKFFEGEAAVQASMEELANNPKFRTDMDYGVFPLELVYKLFASHSLRKYIDLRLYNNRHFSIIYTSEEGTLPVHKEPEYNQEAIRVDQKDYPLSCDINIFEDEVRIHMLGKTIYGILIKNQELADTLLSILKLARKGANQAPKAE